MSTRSLIAIENPDKTITSVYCHFNGYPSSNGSILYNHYDEQRTKELLSFGDMSILGIHITPDPDKVHKFIDYQLDVCLFYGRDRGEKGTEAITHADIKAAYKWGVDSWAEYVYVLRNGVWYIARPDKTGRIRYIKLTERNTQ